MNHQRRYPLVLLTIAIGVGVVVLDQGTKWWAVNTLSLRERVPVLGDLLGLQLIYNPGAAFSLGTDATWIFTIISAVAVGVAIWFTLRVRILPWAIVIGCLGGAAVSHLGDRLLRPPSFGQGHIVDFIAYGDWFIGNIADIFIVGGVVAVLILAATEHDRDTAEAPQ
ncbi:signal peptidase II [Citricoccus sp. NPDC079358]|jgi:signal peptidase II|uniref:signal peptidase II n=1 Tax=Citricoccus sp. NPDC079358 TaxID=3154653 RepID=UPI00344CD430